MAQRSVPMWRHRRNRLVIQGDMYMASKSKKGKLIVSTLKNVYPAARGKSRSEGNATRP